MKKRPAIPFTHRMRKAEKLLLGCYLPVHAVALPLLIGLFYAFVDSGLSEMALNVIYYYISFFCCFLLGRRFLRAEFDAMLDEKRRFFFGLVYAVLVYFALSYLLSIGLLIGGDLVNPNQDYTTGLAAADYGATFAIAVFLGPLVEETLFRGLLFGSLRRHSRFWAYAISTVLFCVYHVWQFVYVYQDFTLLLAAAEYIPAAIALALAYESTDSIWGSTFLHMLINCAAMLLTKASL